MFRSRPEILILSAVFVIAGLILGFGHIAEEVLEGDSEKFDHTILLFFRHAGDVSQPIGPPWIEEMAISLAVPVKFRRRGVEAKLMVLGHHGPAAAPDANLVKAFTRAHDWFGRLVRSEANGIGDIASAERLCRTYVTRVLCLAFLSPEITKGILEGRQPTELTAKRLIGGHSRHPCFGTIKAPY